MNRLALLALVSLVLAGCAEKLGEPPGGARGYASAGDGMFAAAEPMPEMEEAGAPPPPAAKKASRQRSEGKPMSDPPLVGNAKGGESELDAEEEQAAVRSWFPETLLFEPLLLTDEAGEAQLDVTVPDRLTSWRVLALAHSRQGAQAGAVTTFTSTLPLYVDPVVPPWLMAGDRVALPVQVMNTTTEAQRGSLVVEATGGRVEGKARALTVPAEGSRTELVWLTTDEPGELTLRASLGGEDAVERTLAVRSPGKAWERERGGTLAAPRSVALALPEAALPDTASVRLAVFPGALAVLRDELASAGGRGGASSDAYLLALAGRAKGLLASLGGEVDDDELRRLRLLATQRALRHTRPPDGAVAALFADAARAHEDDPLLTRLGERLAEQVARTQRPDGTFLGGDGWTLPRLLAATASSLAALGEHERYAGHRLKARSAFERLSSRAQDGYTAAAILASGAAPEGARDKLVATVLAALEETKDGAQVLRPTPAAQRPDGTRPSETEATALAVLALRDEPKAKAALADLGAALLSRYRPGHGFGDGETNLVALRAVLALFSEPLPKRIELTLSRGGEAVARGVLEGDKLLQVARLGAALPSAASDEPWEVKAEPAVPGLGYRLTLACHVPWPEAADDGGLVLAVERRGKPKVSRPYPVTVRATAPGGAALVLRHALPAGVLADERSLQRLVDDGVLTRFVLEEGFVVLHAPPRRQGQSFAATYRVVPTLAGTLGAPPSSVALHGRDDTAVLVPSPRWVIER